MIEEARVTVAGKTAELGTRCSDPKLVKVDGRSLPATATGLPRVLLYHKPRGEIVSREGEASVFDNLPSLQRGRWLNVGRLDVDSEGLLLFTDNGDAAFQLAHPGGGYERVYLARSSKLLDDDVLQQAVERGVHIDDELVRPLRFSRRSRRDTANEWYEIAVAHGRNRMVRRLFEALHAQVNRLMRIRFGGVALPRELQAGSHMLLSPAEVRTKLHLKD